MVETNTGVEMSGLGKEESMKGDCGRRLREGDLGIGGGGLDRA